MGCTVGMEPFLGLRSTRLMIQEHDTRHCGSRSTGGLRKASQTACTMILTQTHWTTLHGTVSMPHLDVLCCPF